MDGPKLMHELIFILMYAEDVALFSYNLDDMQHDVLDTFCQITRIIVNVVKTKMMAIQLIEISKLNRKVSVRSMLKCITCNICSNVLAIYVTLYTNENKALFYCYIIVCSMIYIPPRCVYLPFLHRQGIRVKQVLVSLTNLIFLN